MAENIGKLEVTVDANTAAAQAKLTQFTKNLQGQLKSIGTGFTQAGKLLSAALTVPLLAIGAVAVESAMQVGKGYRIIQQRTGETGESLNQLKGNFRNLYANVPENSETVATAIASVNKILDLSGPALETTVDGMLDLARVSGGDAKASVTALSHAFKEWNIPAEDMGKELDFLYGVFTDTQVPVEELAAEVAKMGPMLKTSGIGFEQAASMIGLMKESGIDASPIMTGLRKVIKEAGDEGKPAAQKLKEVFTAIKEAKSPTEAAKIAIESFGSRAGPVLASKIRDGTLSIDGLTKSVKNLNLQKTADDTRTFGDAWTIVRHNLELAMEPLGTTIIQLSKEFIPIIKVIIGIVGTLVGAFGKLPQPVKYAIIAAGGFLAALGPILIVIGSIISALAPIVGVIGSIAAALAPVLTTLIGGGGILAAIGSIGIGGTTLAGIFATLSPILVPVAAALGAIVLVIGTIVGIVGSIVLAFGLWYTTSKSLRDIVGGALKTIGDEFDTLKDTIGKVIDALKSGDWETAIETIKDYVQGVIDKFTDVDWRAVWDSLVESLRESIKTIGDVVGGIRDELVKWVDKTDFKVLGHKIGDFIGKAVVAFFKGSVDLLRDILNAIGGGSGAEEEGKRVGEKYGTGISNYFKGGQFKIDLSNAWEIGAETFASVREALEMELTRVKIDWNLLGTELTTGFILLGKLAGIALANVIILALKPLLDKLGVHIEPIGLEATMQEIQAWARNVAKNSPVKINALMDNWAEFKAIFMRGIDGISGQYVKVKSKMSSAQIEGFDQLLKDAERQKLEITPDLDPSTMSSRLSDLIATYEQMLILVPVNAETAPLRREISTQIKIAEGRKAIIDINADPHDFQTRLADLEKDLMAEHKLNVAAKVDDKELQNLINDVRALQGLPPIDFDADTRKATKKVGDLKKSAEAKGTEVPVDADTDDAKEEVNDLKEDVTECPNCKIPVMANTNLATKALNLFKLDVGKIQLPKLTFPAINVSGAITSLNQILSRIKEIFMSLPGVQTAKQFIQDTLAWVGRTAIDIKNKGVELWNTAQTKGREALAWIYQKGIEVKNNAVTYAQNAWTWLSTTASTWAGKARTFATTAAQSGWNYLTTTASTWASKAKTFATTAAQTGYNYLTTTASTWATTARTYASNAIKGAQPIINGIYTWWNLAQGKASEAIRGAQGILSGMYTWYNTAQGYARTAIQGAQGIMSGIYTWWGTAQTYAQNAINGAQGILSAMYGWGAMAVTYARAAINAAISAYNNWNDVLHLPDIGYVAEGGLVTQPTLAMIGEAGPELIIPLDRLGGKTPPLGGGITINVTGNTILDDRAASQLAMKIRDAIRHERGVIR